MLASSGVQAVKSYSTQARAGDMISARRRTPDFPHLTGTDNINISGRSMALAVAKSFTARLAQAQAAEQPAVSQAIASNIQTAVNVQEAVPVKKKGNASELPKEAVLGFSSMSKESVEKAASAIKKLQEPPPDKYHTRINIDDFSLKFIRALNPIPV